MTQKTQIFVDGNCIVCDFEISHYKRIAPNLFDIVDISAANFDAGRYKLSAEAVNKHMHVLTPQGEIKIGVDAFAYIWSLLPKYKFAAVLIKLPIINSIAKIGYWAFAIVRPLLPKKRRA
jgi:predicted DCC family thiol-disulfide oxidoreductase YuxK